MNFNIILYFFLTVIIVSLLGILLELTKKKPCAAPPCGENKRELNTGHYVILSHNETDERDFIVTTGRTVCGLCTTLRNEI